MVFIYQLYNGEQSFQLREKYTCEVNNMLTSIHFNIHIWLVAIPKENNNNNNKNRFPQWLGHEECTCKCKKQRGHTFDFRARMIPWRRKGQHIPVFFLDNPMDTGARWDTIHDFKKESDMTKHKQHFQKRVLQSNSVQSLSHV